MQNNQYGKVHTDGSRSGGQPRNPADVQQADRDAAASYWASAGSLDYERIVAGKDDNTDLVQAFARHRIAALQQSRSAVIEECAKVAEEYPSPMNDLPMALAMRSVASAIRALSQESADAG